MKDSLRIYDNVVEIDVGVDTAAHIANDVVCQPTELPDICHTNGCAVITSLVIEGYDAQAAALNVVFLREPVTVGANNATMNIPDTQAHHVLGIVNVTAGDYVTLAANSTATVRNIGLIVKAKPATPTSIWVAIRTTGTPTYASGRLTLKVGVLRG